ncbi:rab11 family-interacting protein 4A isoform X2 [Cryptotermes secundus]|uniref:rab11 family-interacting protein 4A isoform X2 n=1 Tax=Cryptotermes secundus TaxID=105785 RepID=UPI000CD7B019|nr:rab11 family-interacting protein 4A isoform X2 [Cryptotermes secundus]
MPATMPSVTSHPASDHGRTWTINRQQLRDVFALCDPEGTGFVSLEHLLQLGRTHCDGSDSKDVECVLRQLDPEHRGVLGYPDFCRGVFSILRSQRKLQQRHVGSETMMAPSVYQPQQHDHLVASNVGHKQSPLPPPSFVLTSSSREEESPGSPHSLIMADDVDSAIGDSGSPDMNGKSQCSSMSDGENYECYGEGVELELENTSVNTGDRPGTGCRSPTSNLGLTRNTWLRTSLRRTPPSPQHQEVSSHRRWGSFRHPGKRLGSNALASQLYRSSSFNSSGRSSTCDTADDIYSDVSLEEDVIDLNHKVQMLQQQVSVLADNQNNTDDRYTRAKQDSAALQARVHMLEEQLRESELRAEERLQEEQKRHRELMVRIEREKQLQVENCTIRLQTLELEGASLREECTRLRSQVERLRAEKQASEELRGEEQVMLAALREELQTLRDIERRTKDERRVNAQFVEELNSEIDRLKAERKGADIMEAHSQSELNGQLHDDLTGRLHELQVEVTSLRHQNKNLQETVEELQAQMLTRSLEEGRNLLTGVGNGNSLAEELEAMSAQELRDKTEEQITLEKMRTALKEQQEVNSQLRSYIDGILLNIVDNYPQLLEVKTH